MPAFWVEGTFIRAAGVNKTRKGGKSGPAEREPFGKTIWAESADEALRLATADLDGGQWVDGPRVGRKSEEQRMRARRAPELPGLLAAIAKSERKSR